MVVSNRNLLFQWSIFRGYTHQKCKGLIPKMAIYFQRDTLSNHRRLIWSLPKWPNPSKLIPWFIKDIYYYPVDLNIENPTFTLTLRFGGGLGLSFGFSLPSSFPIDISTLLTIIPQSFWVEKKVVQVFCWGEATSTMPTWLVNLPTSLPEPPSEIRIRRRFLIRPY